jgi:hypothetical protein
VAPKYRRNNLKFCYFFSLTCSQIWLSPLTNNRQPASVTNLKKFDSGLYGIQMLGRVEVQMPKFCRSPERFGGPVRANPRLPFRLPVLLLRNPHHDHRHPHHHSSCIPDVLLPSCRPILRPLGIVLCWPPLSLSFDLNLAVSPCYLLFYCFGYRKGNKVFFVSLSLSRF